MKTRRGSSVFAGAIVSLCAALIMLGCAGTPTAARGEEGSGRSSGPSVVYWTYSNNGPDPEHVVMRAYGDGSNQRAIVSRPRAFVGWFLAVDRASGQVLWTTVGAVARTNLAGTASVVRQGSYPAPMGIAVDSGRRLVYWADSDLKSISVSKLDGSGARTVLSNLGQPRGLALDSTNNTLSWTEPGDGEVLRSTLGTNAFEVFASSRDYPGGIAVDPLNGKVYWTESSGSIIVASADGTEIAPLIDGLAMPTGVAVDPAEGKVYWTDGGSKKVRRANLDGTGVETIADTSSYFPWGIAVLPGR